MGKIYYKVVSVDLKSLIAKNENFCIEYKIGEWIKPRVEYTDIMVFSSLEYAKNFRAGHPKKIFECEVKNPRKVGLFDDWLSIANKSSYFPEYMKIMIKLRKNKKKYINCLHHCPPDGTIFCSAVKLIKEINK